MNLGDLAKKLLVKPIVSIGKAIGRDYQSTIYGPDWRERALMRRQMANLRMREGEAAISLSGARARAELESAGYNRKYKEAMTGDIEERAAARERERLGEEEAARHMGLTTPEYRARKAALAEQSKTAMDAARMRLLGATAEGKERWADEGMDAFIERSMAGAAASRRRAAQPITAPRGTARVTNDEKALMGSAAASGDPAKIKKAADRLKGIYGKSAIVSSFGEDSPLLPLLYPEDLEE